MYEMATKLNPPRMKPCFFAFLHDFFAIYELYHARLSVREFLSQCIESYWRRGAVQFAMRVPVDEHNECWRRFYIVKRDDFARSLIIAPNFHDLQFARVFLREGMKVWLELTAGPAAIREELDKHRCAVLDDLALEGGVVCVVKHPGRMLQVGQDVTFGWGGGIRTHE